MMRYKSLFISMCLSCVAAVKAGAQSYPLTIASPESDGEIQRKMHALRFDDAREAIEARIKQARKKREATERWESLMERCTDGMNALSGTDRVLIVDSVVIDKTRFLDAYGILPEMGKLVMSANGETVSYKAQLSGMELMVGGTPMQILRKYSDDDAEPQAVAGLGVDGDVNYPFLLSDGQQFYFAARSEDGHGNYDLYATRYDNDSKRFYRAENMGFPYNSYANDYMLVIDEVNGLGWFASDRYQPEGCVCVYTFIPHYVRHTFNEDELTDEQLINAASLRSIAQLQSLYTDEERELIANAKATIASLSAAQRQSHKSELEFVIDNGRTYYSINDFQSTKARQLCKQWQQFVKNYATLEQQLADMRSNPKANAQKIVGHERRLLELKGEINSLAKTIRAEEMK